MVPSTDLALLTRWKAGDEAAFSAVVERHRPMVEAVARRVLGDHHAAEDVAQATFLVLARKADALAGGDPDIGGWLHRVARDLARDRRSAEAARRRHEGAAMPVTATAADPVTQAAMRSEFLRQIDDALAALPERQRACLVLHHLEGLPVNQVAVRLGSPEGSVCQWLSRGRERLRRILERRGVAVSAALLLTLLSDDALAATGSAAPWAASNATAQALADSHLRQQTLRTLAWSGAGLAAAGLVAAGLYVGFSATPLPVPTGVAIPAAPQTQNTSDMPSRPILAATLTAALAATAPNVGAADAAGAAPTPGTTPSSRATTGPDAHTGLALNAPAPVVITQDEAATLGAAARVLSKGNLQVRVADALENLPIVYPADGRFSGTAFAVVRQLAMSHGQQPPVTVTQTTSDRGVSILVLLATNGGAANGALGGVTTPRRQSDATTPAPGGQGF
jgi:RNA polymerase sigma factor (sigma-70 family)